jgi:hypothetical protein
LELSYISPIAGGNSKQPSKYDEVEDNVIPHLKPQVHHANAKTFLSRDEVLDYFMCSILQAEGLIILSPRN